MSPIDWATRPLSRYSDFDGPGAAFRILVVPAVPVDRLYVVLGIVFGIIGSVFGGAGGGFATVMILIAPAHDVRFWSFPISR